MSPHSNDPSAVAYSYIRFSSPEQAKGDSLRRQTQKTAEWCERRGIHLDASLSLRDLGVSAFKGRHRDDKKALGQFLKLVERGRIPKGSYLVIENLDRLSREDERKALRLWMDILDAGINIVQLTPETVFRHDKTDMMDVMRAIIELSRGHSESVIKSERLARAWQERKRKGRENGDTVTNRLPAWIEERDGKRVLIPERAAVVKRIFQLAGRDYGHGRIARLLNAEHVPPIGRSGVWCRAYIALLVARDRRVLGEYQPKFRDGTPDGDPILDYFPPAVTKEEWIAAQRGRAERRINRRDTRPVDEELVKTMYRKGETVGAIAKELEISRPRVYRLLAKLRERQRPQDKGNRRVHLFSGLLVNARDGLPYYPTTRYNNDGKKVKALVASSREKNGPHAYGFPYEVFERAVLECLREINPKEILEGANGHDDVVNLETELGIVQAELVEMSSFMEENGFSTTIGKRIAKLEDQERELLEKLQTAQQKAANPLSASWGEMRSLLDVLDNATDPEDVRIRLRAALKRIVEKMHLLVVHQGKERLAWVQIDFTEGPHREYQIRSRQATVYNSGFWQVQSCRADEFPSLTAMAVDLADRHCDDCMVGQLESMIEDVDTIFRHCEKHIIE